MALELDLAECAGPQQHYKLHRHLAFPFHFQGRQKEFGCSLSHKRFRLIMGPIAQPASRMTPQKSTDVVFMSDLKCLLHSGFHDRYHQRKKISGLICTVCTVKV